MKKITIAALLLTASPMQHPLKNSCLSVGRRMAANPVAAALQPRPG